MKIKIRKKQKKIIAFLTILIAAVMYTNQYVKDNLLPKKVEHVSFAKCVDGDTVRLNIDGKEEVVRFLAIDTPETVKAGTPVQTYGKEASEMTCGALTNANEIQLEFEQGNKTDKYQRVLAWIWVDGVLLQQRLIEEGYAEVKYIYGDYKYTEQLEAAQRNAKELRKGIWGN